VTKTQRRAIKALRSWGWKDVYPLRRHRVMAGSIQGDAVTVWCARTVVEYAEGRSKWADQGCPKHSPGSAR
jgi:hypothetical protein